MSIQSLNLNRIPDRLYVALIMLLSGGIQLSFISKSSIWHDEGFTYLLIGKGFFEIISRTARDVHPPFYYLCLSLWTSLFGTSELALRSLSTLCIVLCVALGYLLMRHLFSRSTARTAGLLLATAPFLIRYGQEARMFAMVALLLLLATYILVVAIDIQRPRLLYLYAIVMALAFYTQYYAAFLVPVHWVYVASKTRLLRDRTNQATNGIPWLKWLPSNRFLMANSLIVALFAPWVPVALAQFSGVQGGYWIGAVSLDTLVSTFYQFLVFFDARALLDFLRLGIFFGWVALVVLALIMNKELRPKLLLLSAFTVVPPAIVYTLSLLSQPIYTNRYFVPSAIAFYCLLAALLYCKPLSLLGKLRYLLLLVIVGALITGVYQVHKQATHQMRELGNFVNQGFEPNDGLVVGEIFAMLDYSYYNRTGANPVIYAPSGEVVNNGEISLFDDRLDNIIVKDYRQFEGKSPRVWVIGKAGEKDYFSAVPPQWRLLETRTFGDGQVRLYQTGVR